MAIFASAALTLMPNQTVVYRVQSAEQAALLARQLRNTTHPVQYKFPPCGTNCISVPTAQIEAALGTRMDLVHGDAIMDVTREGRSKSGSPTPDYAGKASHVREYLQQPDGCFEKRGLTRKVVPNSTPAARAAVSAMRVGGYVMLL